MNKSYNKRRRRFHPSSSVDRTMRALYIRSARKQDMQDENDSLMMLTSDYQALFKAGDLTLALGAGLELVDLGLRIAATRYENARDQSYKTGLFARLFPMMMRALDHTHVGTIADAAISAERALPANPFASHH